jgi:AcrR family transcriptional regulator
MATETKQRIIAGALRQFQLFGFQRTSIDSIANALGMSKKTLYQHFRSKDQLIYAVVDHLVEVIRTRVADALTASTPTETALHHIVEVAQFMSQTITPAMVHDMRTMPEVWTYVERKRAAVLADLGTLIARGQKRGEVRDDLDPSFISSVLLQLVNALVNPTMMASMNLSPGVMVQNVVSLVMRGVLVHTRPRRKGSTHANT